MSDTAIVALDGVSLESVSPYVRVFDVIELLPARTTTTRERLGVPGSIITRDHFASRQVRVQFALLTSDDTQRTAALSDIAGWAMSGEYLTIRDRPGQQLKVVCTATPVTMSKRKYTELCELTFTAFGLPFWEDAAERNADIAVFASTPRESTVYPNSGSVKMTPLSLSIKPLEETLTTARIAVNGAEMAFSGLAVPPDSILTIAYPDGYLVAKYTDADGNEVHCLANRTGDEYLPVYTKTENIVTYQTDVRVTITEITRGWYW